ncbi:hypothetical protein SNE40_005913 [Patella caerulea]|uniref:Uncharacterized protein n=1 Tax=Patella caerulea TaxID=87958 RepID=A0AAN8K1D6_PATCE
MDPGDSLESKLELQSPFWFSTCTRLHRKRGQSGLENVESPDCIIELALGETPIYGPKLMQFLEDTRDNSNYMGEELKKEKGDERLQDDVISVVKTFVNNVNDRFPDNTKMAAFRIFSPKNYPDNIQLPTFGTKELSILLEHFCDGRQSATTGVSLPINRLEAEG